ncbi:hypothetical protein [Nostoc sp.]|nr:hypothetical protein [Nostoc sp. ChiQUE02]
MSIYILSSSAIARILPRVFLLENLSSKNNGVSFLEHLGSGACYAITDTV